MKKMIGLMAMTFLSCYSFCQETLQSVTDRGNYTSAGNPLVIRSGDDNTFTFIGGTPSSGIGRIGAYNGILQSWMPLCINEGGGNVGIGTTAPAYKLDINGSGRFYRHGDADFLLLDHQGTQTWRHGISTANTSTYVISNDLGGQSANKILALTDVGNVGIGTTSPVYKLEVNGNFRARNQPTTGPGVSSMNVVALSNDSYNHGNYEAQVASGDFAAGARPGYGFHASGSFGTYLYADGALDIKLRANGGTSASFWTTANFNPANYLPLSGGAIAGDVAIGVSSAQKSLDVNGNIKTRKIKVTVTDWADYVFDSSYQLPALAHVETFIKENKHLPEVPSAADVKKDGLDLGDSQAVLLKKIEELTLYIIQQNKKMEQMEKRMTEMEAKSK